MSHQPSILFEPATLGAITLRNRVVMAPLTRRRAGPDEAPHQLHETYYRQRAGAGLIISEATHISPQGKGYLGAPGIYSPAQIEGWRRVTDAVHAEGGRIILQLWHVGRISHPDLQPGGALPVAPSAVAARGQVLTPTGHQAFVVPRALEASELPGIARDFAQGARNAIAAGFDGVQIHGANGYLIDQFLRDGANKRTDAYGGSVENRLRFPLMVVDAVVAAVGAERTSIRLSPVSPASDLADSDPAAVFFPFVEALSARRLASVEVVEGATGGPRETDFDFDALRARFQGTWIANNGYDRALAIRHLAERKADLIAFGRPFISNPDLVERLRRDAPLTPMDKATAYHGGAEGYTDYPALAG